MDAMKSHCVIGGRGVSGFFLVEGKRVPPLLKGPLSASWIPAPNRLPSSRAAAISLERPKPIPPPACAPAVPEEASDNVAELGMQAEGQSRRARVRIVLEKQCVFGQQFFLVGDGPLLGDWDPSNAVPLEWTAGHAWKAEMDFPIGASVQFKFIRRSFTGEIDWQPGPDRVVRVWETTNTIVVTEDWENEEEQKIIEEPLTNLMEDVVTTKSITDSNEEPLANHTEDLVAMESMVGGNNRAALEQVAMGVLTRSQVRTSEERIPHSTKSEELVSFEDLVLIPGITPASVPMTASLFSNEVVNGNVDDASLANSESENHIASQVNV